MIRVSAGQHGFPVIVKGKFQPYVIPHVTFAQHLPVGVRVLTLRRNRECGERKPLAPFCHFATVSSSLYCLHDILLKQHIRRQICTLPPETVPNHSWCLSDSIEFRVGQALEINTLSLRTPFRTCCPWPVIHKMISALSIAILLRSSVTSALYRLDLCWYLSIAKCFGPSATRLHPKTL